MGELFFAIVSIPRSMKIVVILLAVAVPLAVAFPAGLLGNVIGGLLGGGNKNVDKHDAPVVRLKSVSSSPHFLAQHDTTHPSETHCLYRRICEITSSFRHKYHLEQG